MDTAVLVISLVLGFALVLMFIYRLGIEERFDRAAVACLIGGLVLLAMASLGRFSFARTGPAASLPPSHANSDVVVERLDAQVSTAMSTASRALTVAAEAKEHAALKPSIQRLDAKISALKLEVAAPKTEIKKPARGKSAWTRRMEAKIRALERQVAALKKASPANEPG